MSAVFDPSKWTVAFLADSTHQFTNLSGVTHYVNSYPTPEAPAYTNAHGYILRFKWTPTPLGAILSSVFGCNKADYAFTSGFQGYVAQIVNPTEEITKALTSGTKIAHISIHPPNTLCHRPFSTPVNVDPRAVINTVLPKPAKCWGYVMPLTTRDGGNLRLKYYLMSSDPADLEFKTTTLPDGAEIYTWTPGDLGAGRVASGTPPQGAGAKPLVMPQAGGSALPVAAASSPYQKKLAAIEHGREVGLYSEPGSYEAAKARVEADEKASKGVAEKLAAIDRLVAEGVHTPAEAQGLKAAIMAGCMKAPPPVPPPLPPKGVAPKPPKAPVKAVAKAPIVHPAKKPAPKPAKIPKPAAKKGRQGGVGKPKKTM